MFNLFRSVCQFRRHESSLVAIGVLLEEVGEKEYLENDKDNEQFNQDNRPQRLAEVHIPKTVVIEVEDPVKESLFVHRRSINFCKYKGFCSNLQLFCSFFLLVL